MVWDFGFSHVENGEKATKDLSSTEDLDTHVAQRDPGIVRSVPRSTLVSNDKPKWVDDSWFWMFHGGPRLHY